jgi:DNA-binding ferritin-like protein
MSIEKTTYGTRRLQQLLSVMVAVISLAAVPISLYMNWKQLFAERPATTGAIPAEALEKRLTNLEVKLSALDSKLESLSQAVETARKNPGSLSLASLDAEIRRVGTQVDAVTAALGVDVERTLSVPLLRKDIQQIQEQVDQRTATASKEIDRIYDQNKWFLGLMGTMALGLLGLAVSNFLQARKPTE